MRTMLTNNISFFNGLRYRWFQEKGLTKEMKGVWIWISDHFKNKDMSLVFDSTFVGLVSLVTLLGAAPTAEDYRSLYIRNPLSATN